MNGPRYLVDYRLKYREVPIQGRYIILPARLAADPAAQQLAAALVERLIDRTPPSEPPALAAPFTCLEVYDLNGWMRDVIWSVLLTFASYNDAQRDRSPGRGEEEGRPGRRQIVHVSSSYRSARAFYDAVQGLRKELEVAQWGGVTVTALVEPADLCVKKMVKRRFRGRPPELNTSCRGLVTGASCSFKANLPPAPAAPLEDIESLAAQCAGQHQCPYYALAAVAPSADLVFTTYAVLGEVLTGNRLADETLYLGAGTVLVCEDAFALEKALSSVYNFALLPRGLRLVADYVREREVLRGREELVDMLAKKVVQYQHPVERVGRFVRFLEACIKLACEKPTQNPPAALLSTFLRRSGLKHLTLPELQQIILSSVHDMLQSRRVHWRILRAAVPALTQLLRFVSLLDNEDVFPFLLADNPQHCPFRLYFRPDMARYPLQRFPFILSLDGCQHEKVLVEEMLLDGRGKRERMAVVREEDRRLSRRMDFVGYSSVPALEALRRWEVAKLLVYGSMTPVTMDPRLMPLFRLQPPTDRIDRSLLCRLIDHVPPDILLHGGKRNQTNPAYQTAVASIIAEVLGMLPQQHCVTVMFANFTLAEDVMEAMEPPARDMLQVGMETLRGEGDCPYKGLGGLECGACAAAGESLADSGRPVVVLPRGGGVDGVNWRVTGNQRIEVVIVVGMAFGYFDDPFLKVKQEWLDVQFGSESGASRAFYWEDALYQTLRPFLVASGATAAEPDGPPHRLLLLLDSRLKNQPKVPVAIERSLRQNSFSDYATLMSTDLPAFIHAALHRPPAPLLPAAPPPPRPLLHLGIETYIRRNLPDLCYGGIYEGREAICREKVRAVEGMSRCVEEYVTDENVELLAVGVIKAANLAGSETFPCGWMGLDGALAFSGLQTEFFPFVAGMQRFLFDLRHQRRWELAMGEMKAQVLKKADKACQKLGGCFQDARALLWRDVLDGSQWNEPEMEQYRLMDRCMCEYYVYPLCTMYFNHLHTDLFAGWLDPEKFFYFWAHAQSLDFWQVNIPFTAYLGFEEERFKALGGELVPEWSLH